MTNPTDAPTYICIRRYPDGETWIDETKVGSTLLEAVKDLDNLVQVLLLEDGKTVDQSAHAAEIYWQHHGHEYDSMFDVEQFLHEHLHNDVYDDISARKYNVRCQQNHERGVAQ